MILVVSLTVDEHQKDAFRAYERRAALIMARHGGRIERTVLIPGATPETFPELHLVRFDGADVVPHTEVSVGDDGPDYTR